MPLSDKFFDKLNRNPDLYGPVWISSTVIFMLTATANFADWLEYVSTMRPTWTYDFTKMTLGATIIYAYTFGVPLLVYLALRYAGTRVAFTEVICLYGYSLFVYIPASILCIPPAAWLQWLVVSVAALASTAFVVRSLRHAATRDRSDARITSVTIAVRCSFACFYLLIVVCSRSLGF